MKWVLLPLALLAAPMATAQNSAPEIGIARALYRAGNVPAAIAKLEEAANNGNGEAANLLGDLYYEGANGVPADKARALEWYRKGAAAGFPAAIYSVGYQIEKGEGVAADKAEAFTWYERAARAGHPRSAYMVGDALMNGTGVAKDPAKGVP